MLWIDFVNSDVRDHLGRGRHEDRLEKPGWLAGLAKQWQLAPVAPRRGEPLQRLRRFRSVLRRCADAIVAGQAISARDIKALNDRLGAGTVRPRIDRARRRAFRLTLEPAAGGVEGFLFKVAESFASFLVDADLTRLKTCDNPDCRWVFYDDTRSRTRRWCATNCGDLMKVRQFRKRQKRQKGRSP